MIEKHALATLEENAYTTQVMLDHLEEQVDKLDQRRRKAERCNKRYSSLQT
jgi:hypothetical protein